MENKRTKALGMFIVLAAVLLAALLVFMDYVGVVLITICILVLAIPAKAKSAEPVKLET